MKKIKVSAQDWVEAPGYKKQLLLSDKELQCGGTRVQMVVMAPHTTIKDHYHKTSREFYYVVQGACLLTINKQTYRLTPGDMLLTEPGEIHKLINDGDEEFKLLVFKTNTNSKDTYWLDTSVIR
jgi:quercetin dioxygenase-like cupin family protein